MSDPARERSVGGFRDRRRGLVVYGAIAIVLGALSALVGAAGGLPAAMPPQGGTQAPHARSGAVAPAFYVSLGVLPLWLCIGSIPARRRGRPLILVVARAWLL